MLRKHRSRNNQMGGASATLPLHFTTLSWLPKCHRGCGTGVQFFFSKEAYDSETALYDNDALARIMPRHFERVDNADGSLQGPGGFVFPPVLVIERGESLYEFGRRVAHDPITLVQALIHVVDRVQTLHAVGLVHRDLKPGNILRMPESHSWTLIDFGCCAANGAHSCAYHSINTHVLCVRVEHAGDVRRLIINRVRVVGERKAWE